MARVNIRGVIIPNDYKWYYSYFDMDSTCPRDVQKIIDAHPNEELEVYINSPGGVIDVGSEIYTLLREHKAGVKIKIMGEACSAASVIAMAGYSEMSPTSLIMVHCVSSGARGNHNDMEHAAEMLRTADSALCTSYMTKTGMTEEEALKMMEHETWLNATQAKERGLIDKIMFEDEEKEPLPMVAGMFQLPTEEQLNKAKQMAGLNTEPAFSMQKKAEMKLNLLKMKGATK